MNMQAMAQSEFATLPEEIEFENWVARVEGFLSRGIKDLEKNGIAHDLYVDGCSPEDAAEEITQQ